MATPHTASLVVCCVLLKQQIHLVTPVALHPPSVNMTSCPALLELVL